MMFDYNILASSHKQTVGRISRRVSRKFYELTVEGSMMKYGPGEIVAGPSVDCTVCDRSPHRRDRVQLRVDVEEGSSHIVHRGNIGTGSDECFHQVVPSTEVKRCLSPTGPRIYVAPMVKKKVYALYVVFPLSTANVRPRDI